MTSSSSRWEIRNDSTKNSSSGQSSEKITLCVRSRSNSSKQEPKESSRKAKSSKKSKSSSKPSGSKSRRQPKDEYASTGEDNADMETTDAEDSTMVANQVDEAAVQQARQELINNALLKEILNEKKRALFESEEMLQFFKERNKSFYKSHHSSY
ncbi:uncharacterized protein LOC135942831 [Cloeon dipterum]|uniref:uncharacterized protein LOC135942831 n=1 Tax=Cloeon dipterum TaxID=197152 RepID=UPI00321FFB1E